MDERTLKALEFGKVLEHIARSCLSEAGQEACSALLPLRSQDAVHHAHRLLDELRTWLGVSEIKLAGFHDIRPVFRFAENNAGPLDLDALWMLKDVFSQLRPLAQSLGQTDGSGNAKFPVLAELAAHPLPEMTLSALTRCISDEGLLKDESSPDLMLVRSELRQLHQGCLRQVKDFSARYNIAHYLQDEYMTLASDRYVLPLKSNFKGRLQGIVHDYSQTGETCYFEPMFLVEQNNRLQELKRQEREEEHKVLAYLSEIVRNELPASLAAWDLLVALDVLRAKSLFADATRAVSVTVDSGVPLNLGKARHPLLALELKDAVQPLDLSLRNHDQALIISGGNAGGKTVCLKTLGLLAVMTYAGIPVPVEPGSTLPWWPDIHAFIGDEQSLDDHVSTFTAQIRHLNRVWENAGAHTLVLLDEFGAGTDPAQGAALAQAVIDELLALGANVVAATHFPALKTYALMHDHVRAASVLFDPDTQQPLFRIAYDQVGASRALDVAREHGLPGSVIKRAEQYLLQDGQDSGPLLDRLNALTAEREKEAEALAAERRRMKEKRERLQERFDADRKKLEEEVRASSQTIMKEYQEGRMAHKQAMRELARVRAELAAQEEESRPAAHAPLCAEQLSVGQTVVYAPWNKQAQVTEVDNRQKRVKVDIGGVSMWAEISQIASSPAQSGQSLTSGAQKNMKGASGRAALRSRENQDGSGPLFSLDLRGKRADLAETELSRFLDNALLSGRDEVEIIHGRGTGVLRKQVHAMLRGFPGIESYHLAPEDRGGDGMTIVTFR